jgi:hypothetical protein
LPGGGAAAAEKLRRAKYLRRVTVLPDGLRLEGQRQSGKVLKTCRGPGLPAPIRTDKEIDMKSNMFRICAMLAVGLTASIPSLQAQQHTLEGVWNVSVSVTDCNTGALIRTVHSLQSYHHDGTVTETANTASRGISEGAWKVAGAQTYQDSFYFYRYTSTGTFASLAHGTDTITLDQSGHYTSVGKIQDFDANGTLLSTGCVIHTAYRLEDSE